jgi:hypothetical protein
VSKSASRNEKASHARGRGEPDAAPAALFPALLEKLLHRREL